MSATRLVRGSIAWPGVEEAVTPYLRKALAEGGDKDWDLPQILDLLRAGRWGLYGVTHEGRLIGAGTTCIQHYGKRSVLEIVMFAADIGSKAWQETLSAMREEAKLLGCSAIQGRGRPGWARYLGASPVHGFEIEV